MPRPLRIEYPGAFYHIYSRGNRKQPIFFSDDDRYYFLKVLREANDRLGIFVHVYCLMDNHYHLILETPESNLSQTMHFINASYAIYLNKKREMCGHLFQSRFQAILVQADTYARTLTIYIHGNPVRKKMVDRPEQFQWSSCQDYYGVRDPPSWLETSIVLRVFGDSRDVLRAQHENNLLSDNISSFEKDLRDAFRIGILGDDDFIDRVRRSHLRDRIENLDENICELRRLRVRPPLSEIEGQINRSLGGESKLSRKCIILLAHSHAAYKLKEIGDYLGISPAAVSVSYRKAKKEMAQNMTIQNALDDVWQRLNDSTVAK